MRKPNKRKKGSYNRSKKASGKSKMTNRSYKFEDKEWFFFRIYKKNMSIRKVAKTIITIQEHEEDRAVKKCWDNE